MRKFHIPKNYLIKTPLNWNLYLIEEAFKETGMAVNLNVVTDGVEALQYLKQQDQYAEAIVPDLILLDLNLPKKDGREVLEIIKKDDNLMCIPVVVLTTSGAEQDISKVEDFWLSTTVLPTMIN